ncbi:MAG: glycosyltransferase [Candidatus Marinimicrobia bacterium]|nr:glycosyltransferase [Candidatus Neomarinimicrobiota bacterium]
MKTQLLPSDLRVVIFSDDLPNRSGVGSYYQDLVDHLQNQLAGIETICPINKSGHQFKLWQIALPGDPTRNIYFPNVPLIYKKLCAIKPHLIAVTTPGPFGLLGLLISKKYRLPLCYGFHVQYDKLAEIYWNKLVGRLISSIFRLLDKWFFQSSSIVVANSSMIVNIARRLGAQNVSLVGTPIPALYIEKPVSKIGAELESIIFAGRLTAEKNIESILIAAGQMPQLKFSIAGDGPFRAEIQNYSAKHSNLDYLGWLSREQLLSVIDNNDMLILPSHNETFGTIALEAMARQKLVIVSDKCGIARWPALSQGLIVYGDNESLSDAILRVSNMSQRHREDITYRAREAAQTLNEETIFQWLDIFSDIVNP